MIDIVPQSSQTSHRHCTDLHKPTSSEWNFSLGGGEVSAQRGTFVTQGSDKGIYTSRLQSAFIWMISAKTLDQKRAGKDRKNYGAYFFTFNCYEGRQERNFWTNRSEEIKTNSKISLVTFKWDKSSDATFFSKLFEFWRRVGLVVGTLDSESSGLGSSPGPSCSKCVWITLSR